MGLKQDKGTDINDGALVSRALLRFSSEMEKICSCFSLMSLMKAADPTMMILLMWHWEVGENTFCFWWDTGSGGMLLVQRVVKSYGVGRVVEGGVVLLSYFGDKEWDFFSVVLDNKPKLSYVGDVSRSVGPVINHMESCWVLEGE